MLMVSAGAVPAITAAAPGVMIGQDGTHVVALVVELLNDGGAIRIGRFTFRACAWRWCDLEGFSWRSDSSGGRIFGIPFAPGGESDVERLIEIVAAAVGKHEQPALAGPGVDAERQPRDRLVHGAVVELVGGDVAEIGGGDQRIAHGFELRGADELGEGNMHIAPIAILVNFAPAPQTLELSSLNEERNAGHGLGVNIEHNTRGQVVGGRWSGEGERACEVGRELGGGRRGSLLVVFSACCVVGGLALHDAVAGGCVPQHGMAQQCDCLISHGIMSLWY